MTLFKTGKLTFAVAGVIALTEGATPHRARERLFVDCVELSPDPSLAVLKLSPSGFAWGYSGRGADQTALAMCLHIFQSTAVAKALYPHFKAEFVQQWPLARPFNQRIDITDFLLDHFSIISDAYLH